MSLTMGQICLLRDIYEPAKSKKYFKIGYKAISNHYECIWGKEVFIESLDILKALNLITYTDEDIYITENGKMYIENYLK